MNEELAATAVWGSQQVGLFPGAKYDGVFAMWYGKGPGVDRSGDAFKHGNAAGTSKHGGVLLLAGDDHACKSSTLPHQSEHAFDAAMIPVLYPTGVAEIIEMGLIRRVAVLTKRAAALSHQLQKPEERFELGTLDVADLRGRDELGILAGSLADLLQRVKDSLRREQLRAEREHDQWHAVGHEIMSPLQSLMLLHAGDADPSRRYVQRMQQAVKVLYGQASPSEALAAATLEATLLQQPGSRPHAEHLAAMDELSPGVISRTSAQ